MSDIDKIKAKIKKLLALSRSPNPNEAASTLKMAQELMAEYGVEHSDVNTIDMRKEKQMTLNKLRDEAFDIAEKSGFHEQINFGEKIALVHSELSEALEADRKGAWSKEVAHPLDVWDGKEPLKGHIKAKYENYVRGSVEEELADAIIRIFDIAGIYKIDLDWHVTAKMAYNKTRPKKHGKKY